MNLQYGIADHLILVKQSPRGRGPCQTNQTSFTPVPDQSLVQISLFEFVEQPPPDQIVVLVSIGAVGCVHSFPVSFDVARPGTCRASTIAGMNKKRMLPR